jgi:hypothetical protein
MPAWLRAIDLARLGGREWQPQFCALYSAGHFAITRLLWVIHLYSCWRTWRWHARRVPRKLSSGARELLGQYAGKLDRRSRD